MKKNFLFGLLALMLAGFGFGGISMAQESTQKDYCTLTSSVQTSPIRIGGTADFSVNIKLGTDWVEGTYVKGAFNADSSIPYSNLKYEAWVNGVNYGYQNFIGTEFGPDNGFVAVNDITSKFKVDFSKAGDYIVPVTIINPKTKESYCSTDVEFKVLVAEDDETKFYIQKNTTSYLPLVLNDDNSIDLVNTKNTVAADTNVNATYKGMIAALNEDDLSNLEIEEINGEKVLFINMNGQTSIPNPGTWVFVENASGPLHGVFMTNDQLDGDNVVDSNLYDASKAVSPDWVDLASSTVRHTTAVEVDGKTIGYAIYSEKDGINGWSYAPKAYTITFVDEDGTTVLHTQFVALGKTPVYNGTTPTKAADSSYTYTFKEWTPALVKVTEDATYKATYTLTAKSSGGSSSGGGGSSRSSSTTTTKKDDTKKAEETTKDETKVDETKVDENTNENTGTDIGGTTSNEFSQEFNDAYQFAYKNGITTMPSIEEADMESPLTRIAMAKMLSQYAINVLGKTPDTTKVVPAFPDVTAQMDADYNNGVTLAYQLGIMGIGIDKFRPNDLVTRAEFATALSRLLFNTPDGEGAYYETHLAKLMEEKIITDNNPDLQELRGYVMIMLMRSAQS